MMKTRLFRRRTASERGAIQKGENLNQAKALPARILDVDEARAGLHEKAEAVVQPLYRISWCKKPARLFGIWPLPGTDRGSGKFIRVPANRIKMSAEASRRCEMVSNGNHLGEVAAFIDTELSDSHIGVILAVKNADHWLELCRWQGSWRELGLSRQDICSV